MNRATKLHFARSIIAAICLLSAAKARADRRELYLSASVGPALISLQDSQGGGASTSIIGLSATLSAYYGVTDSWHFGVSAMLTRGWHAPFPGVTARQQDGTMATGTLYEDAMRLGIAALGRYRYDSGSRFAPFGQAEVGPSANVYSSISLLTTQQGILVPLQSVTKFGVGVRGAIGVEYRLQERVMLSAAIAGEANAGGLRPWQVELPLTFAWIF